MIKAVQPAPPSSEARTPRDPQDRQAAVYRINAALEALDVREWSWTVMDWLRLYDGFEQYLPPHDDPVLSTERAFAHVVQLQGPQLASPAEVLAEIERQPFMYWHAQWLDGKQAPVGKAWKPISGQPVPFWDYLRSKPEGAVELRTQRLESMHVDQHAFRSWLMAGWLRFVSNRKEPEL